MAGLHAQEACEVREVNFRGHPHATYKLLSNGLYYGRAKPAQLP